jgi:CRP-like cAMP-binding protein
VKSPILYEILIAVQGLTPCLWIENLRQEENCLLRKISSFVRLSEPENVFLDQLQATRLRIERGREIAHEGQAGQVAYILQAGWACSFKLLPSGGRQIITFPVPGDCIGLRSILLRTSDHSFSALTDVIVTRIDAPTLRRIFVDYPELGMAILWTISREEAMLVEHLVSIGRRSAIERTAYFLLELFDRLNIVGLTRGNEFECPLNQYLLADALGLSTIHVNRVLRQLRTQNLATVRNRHVVIHDPVALRELAGYTRFDGDPPVLIGRDRAGVPQEQA